MEFSTAKVSIAPNWSVHMAGYGARSARSVGVRDDIYARGLLLSDGASKMLFLTLEILFLPRVTGNAIKDEIGKRYGLGHEQILISCTHTHAAPSPLTGEGMPSRDVDEPERRFTAFLRERVLECVDKCFAGMREGSIAVGKGETYIAMNRRQLTLEEVRLAPNPTGYVDRDLFVLAINDADGKPGAILYSCACHNTVLDADNLYITGDYEGIASRELEKAYPGAVCLFLQGACGDNNPATKAGNENHRQTYFSDIEFTGTVLANDVRQVVRRGLQGFQLSLSPELEEVFLPVGPSTVSLLEEKLNDRPALKKHYTKYIEMLKERERDGFYAKGAGMLAGTIKLSGNVRIAVLEGEVCQGIGRNIKKAFQSGYTIVGGYANGVLSYIPTADIIVEGGYEATAAYTNYGLTGMFDPAVEGTITAYFEAKV